VEFAVSGSCHAYHINWAADRLTTWVTAILQALNTTCRQTNGLRW